MKKFLLLFFTLTLCMSTVGCYDDENSFFRIFKSEPEATTPIGEAMNEAENTLISTPYEKALYFIDNGKYEEAYIELYSIRTDEQAAQLLKNFKVVAQTEIYKNSMGDNYKMEYTYDEKGNLIKTVKSNDTDWLDITDYFYEYDDEGRITRRKISAETKYYEKDDVIVEYEYDANGNLIVPEFVFDKDGRLIRETQMLTDTIEYTYDANGNLTMRQHKSHDKIGKTFRFDYNNNVMSSATLKSGDKTSSYDYTYDEKGNFVKCIAQIPNEGEFVLEFEYDANGNKIKSLCEVNDDGNPDTWHGEYTYDAVGNLTSFYEDSYGNVEEITYSDFAYFYIPIKSGPDARPKSYDSPDSMYETTPENPIY